MGSFAGLSPLFLVVWEVVFFCVLLIFGGLWWLRKGLCLVCGLGLVVVVLERFVAKVLQGGKVTIPRRVRELLDVNDGDYVRLDLVEVIVVKGR